MLQCFVLLPTFLIVELSSNCIDQIFFPLTMDVLFIYLFAMFIQAIQFSNAGLNGGLFTY